MAQAFGTVNTATSIPVGSVDISRAVKTADESFTTTALGNVTDLSFPLAANATGTFSFYIPYYCAASTTGLLLGLADTQTPAANIYHAIFPTSATTVSFDGATGVGTTLTSASSPGAIVQGMASLHGTVVQGAASGTVSLQAATEVAGSAATVQRGAWGWMVS